MTKLPALTGHKLIKILTKTGYRIVRQKGSHVFIKNQKGKCTIIPVHKGCDLRYGLLRKILKDLEISPNNFFKLLH